MTTNEETLREELLAAVAELWRLQPDLRLGQMVGNISMMAGRDTIDAIWELEDDEALAATRSMVQGANARSAAA